MRFGSLQNLLTSNVKNTPRPEVGMGATHLGWTDRHPYTITQVVNERTIVVQEDDSKRVDAHGMSESQSYEFTPNPSNPTHVVTLRKNGRWVRKGDSVNGMQFAIGYRSKYHDFSF